MRNLGGDPATPDANKDLSGDSDSDKSEVHDTPFYSLEDVKSFMISGLAFTNLCEAFRLWIQPTANQERLARKTSNSQGRNDVSEQEESAVLGFGHKIRLKDMTLILFIHLQSRRMTWRIPCSLRSSCCPGVSGRWKWH